MIMATAAALFGAVTVVNASLPPQDVVPPRGFYIFVEDAINEAVVGPTRTHGSEHINPEDAERILIESAFQFLVRGLS